MIIIIGAGISGLYLGYMLKKQRKDFLILEKENRYGGRVRVDNFEGESVVLGAGIGRFDKDQTLYNLCTSIGVPVHKYTSTISRVFSVENNKNILKEVSTLQKIDVGRKRSTTTFFDFLKENYKNPNDFIQISGYTDYINADIVDTLYDYGFDDVVSGYTGFSIDWDVLIDKLYESISDHVHLSEEVVEHNNKRKTIRTKKTTYYYEKLICSTPVSIARHIFPTIRMLRDLDCQPFSRIYVKIGKGKTAMAAIIKNFTIIDSYLQKIIPINSKKGIYMIGYNDNYDAVSSFEDFMNLSQTDLYEKISLEIKRVFSVAITIQVAKIVYWKDGTTYYKPLRPCFTDREAWLNKARNPLKYIYFIGEGFSRNQGWVQGSLESVDAIFDAFNY